MNEPKPLTCHGACKRDKECVGAVRRVEVFQGDKSWGRYNYCETAVKCDQSHGYRVEYINED